MSNSTDSLKKKVCVTVFLDELFEEVVAEEEEERNDTKQVNDITESAPKVAEKPIEEPSPVDLGGEEKVEVLPPADTPEKQVQVRPRKHRKESKFSKNRNNLFKNELNRYGYDACVKAENEKSDPNDSAVSDSDFDLNDFLNLDKWEGLEISRSSLMNVSECELTQESFLSVNPVPSSVMISCKVESVPEEKPETFFESSVLYCNKSTQFEVAELSRKENEVSFEKDAQKEEEEIQAWKKTHQQIQLILAEAKHNYREQEACEGDRIIHYDLKSILEECLRKDRSFIDRNIPDRSSLSTECTDLDTQDPSDSYSCVFPHKQNVKTPEVRRVWDNTKKTDWTDAFESDASEPESGHHAEDIGLIPLQNDSLVCYTLCLKRKETEASASAVKAKEMSWKKSAGIRSQSKSSCRKSSVDSVMSQTSREAEMVFEAVTRLGEGALLGTVVKTEKRKRKVGRNDSDQGLSRESSSLEKRSKSFADGDTVAKPPTRRDSKTLSDLGAKERLLVRDEIHEHVGEPEVLCNEVIVNRVEIELHPQNERQEEAETTPQSPQPTSAPKVIAEVLFNQSNESSEKNITAAESEMVFAESENFCDRDEFLPEKYSVDPAPSLKEKFEDICIVEFEDKLSRSKILRRMRTVEILGDSSLNDMKSISTEVILICENTSNNEVCMEASWQSSASTLRSISEMKQCYLKDSQDSAMYLIEIPLHFTHPKKTSGPDLNALNSN